MTSSKKPSLLLVLGFLAALDPLTVDTYLPAFGKMGAAFGTVPGKLSLTLASYFLGMTLGQLCYGPLLDRFGRKRPLYFGLLVYLVASLGCVGSHSLLDMVGWRFFVALGCCVAMVVSFAVVRDLFEPAEATKVFAVIMLIRGSSPLFAPTVGSWLSATLGWQAVFFFLIGLVFVLLVSAILVLPDHPHGDRSVSLRLGNILNGYGELFRETVFVRYALGGSAAFGSLYIFIASSPLLFFYFFHLSAYSYSTLFSLSILSFIGASQVNIFLQKLLSREKIVRLASTLQLSFAVLLVVLVISHHFSLGRMVGAIIGILFAAGLLFPNTTVLALTPFLKNTGRASALMSSTEMFLGATVAFLVSMLGHCGVEMIALLFGVSAVSSFSLLVLL